MSTRSRHHSRTQTLNRTAVTLWLAAVLLITDGFVFQTLPAVIAGVVATIAGGWFANEADS